MDWQLIANLFSSLGFPIACCVVLFWQLNKANEQHKQEMDKMSEAINNNTKAIELLKESIANGKN